MHSHYFKTLQSAQIQHYVLLHNTPAWNPLIRRSASCRLGSHLPAHHRHIPAQHNSTNRHLLPNQHWHKGQRPSQQTESNGWDEEFPPIPPLAGSKSQPGRRSPNQQRHLSGGLLPPPTQCAQSKCHGPEPGRKAEVWAGRSGAGLIGVHHCPLRAERTPSSLSVTLNLSASCWTGVELKAWPQVEQSPSESSWQGRTVRRRWLVVLWMDY